MRTIENKFTKVEIRKVLNKESDRLTDAIVKDNPHMRGEICYHKDSFDVDIHDCNDLVVASVNVKPEIVGREICDWTMKINDRRGELDGFNIQQYTMIFNHYDALERGFLLLQQMK